MPDHAVMCPQAPHRADRTGPCQCAELRADAARKAAEYARATPPWSRRVAPINFRAS